MIQIKRRNQKGTAIKAGIAGAVIGAAGAAIGMSMKDKKNRDTLKKSLTDAKKWTQDKVESVQKSSQNAAESVTEDVKKAQKKTGSDSKK